MVTKNTACTTLLQSRSETRQPAGARGAPQLRVLRCFYHEVYKDKEPTVKNQGYYSKCLPTNDSWTPASQNRDRCTQLVGAVRYQPCKQPCQQSPSPPVGHQACHGGCLEDRGDFWGTYTKVNSSPDRTWENHYQSQCGV